jgi:replication-associated recombination protein RarA
MDSRDNSIKAARAGKLFFAVIDGKKAIKNRNDAKLFLEAMCSQKDRSRCVEKLAASSDGLQALRMSIRNDTSISFVNDSCIPFLAYIQDDDIRQLCNGQLLKDIMRTVIEPPTLWNALEQHYHSRSLSQTGSRTFASLVLDLLTFLPDSPGIDLFSAAAKIIGPGGLLESSDFDIRSIAYKIQNAVRSRSTKKQQNTLVKPGGRHDNDFEDFRKVEIFPTKDELLTAEKPFYLQAEVVFSTDIDNRVATHLDNQFRLLREDMIAELRNDLQAAIKKGKGRRVTKLGHLTFQSVGTELTNKRLPGSVAMSFRTGLPQIGKTDREERKKYFIENRQILKHGAFGCLLASNEIVAFAVVDREEDGLSKDPPTILLQVLGKSALLNTLITFHTVPPQNLEFVLVDTPFFAYQPILQRLQNIVSLPLSYELLALDENDLVKQSPFRPLDVVDRIKQSEGQNLRDALQLEKDVILDESQTASLIAGLTQTLSLIQGPPGTGKSFIGALLAKALYDHTDQRILVLCYTNHALDQFLEDIITIGVRTSDMLRLGSKSTDQTKKLSLHEQTTSHRRTRNEWDLINAYDLSATEAKKQLQEKSNGFRDFKLNPKCLLEFLQYSDNDSEFFDAFSVPEEDDGMVRVDENGKAIGSTYLVDRWSRGLDPGVYQDDIDHQFKKIWEMDHNSRLSCLAKWQRDLSIEQATILHQSIENFIEEYTKLSEARDQRNSEIIKQKRIIGCTTTAAAKYVKELTAAAPGIVIVEEAGEILESHILTALSPKTEHLVLIGDHKQLRPKISNYALSAEKGDGYDLNKSLFERLVTENYPHTTLAKQHRMRPEISAFIKDLMYPFLEDGPSTLERPPLRGLQSNVVFFNHNHPEEDMKSIGDRRDEGAKVSRQNHFEAEIILKIVRYLAQQGYGTENQVVLTPYLGQLRRLMNALRNDLDPVLNDLDSYDLIKAGLLSPSDMKTSKRKLKISTIDNYQGEESDVVVASLTRSNDNGDIGFMSSPERLNVLLSRARDGLIIVGNAKTFVSSRKGGKLWSRFFDQLRQRGQFFEGFPIQCERHPTKMFSLKEAKDFDSECPDGGCSQPCSEMLNCGKHQCPQKCHQLADHSKIQCNQIVETTCPKSHKTKSQCWRQSARCTKCEAERRREEARCLRDYELDVQRQVKEKLYAQQLAEIDDEIAHEKRLQKEHETEISRRQFLEQRRKDLRVVKANTKKAVDRKSIKLTESPLGQETVTQATSPGEQRSEADQSPGPKSSESEDSSDDGRNSQVNVPSAKSEWNHQKRIEFATNEHIDALMEMIGLESVKQQFLTIKLKIDTCIRQGSSNKDERFNAAFLGNPGTGKTTVARLYAHFLASVGVVPGNCFEETSGSRLASDGVQACKKLIENILNNGGGAIFIDEAYQLTSGTNHGGGQVLDYLLAEVENLVGKVVFILAGYNKQMETFFAHNPGLPSRFPYEFQFKDYEDKELQEILEYKIKKRFKKQMKLEDGFGGLYSRIVARRIGYGRGREGFGNARAVENTIPKIHDRQAKRLALERRSGKKPDDFLFTKEDMIGPEPAKVLRNNKSWETLKKLTGLKAVKESVKALFESVQYNYQRELEEKPRLEFSLNRVFLGSPGTGKTTVAKLYGQVLADIGLLSSGEVVVKNPSDFIGAVIGGSERNTKGILASTIGKVLVIDEAYGLSTANDGGSGANQFKIAVIDTIVAEVQSVAGEDRCVLLLGYKNEMETMFQNCNPGLSRRFPLSSAFVFEDFTDDELKVILDLKLNQQGYLVTDQAKQVAGEVLKRARNRPNFGNAGEVDILLNDAKARHQKRRMQGTAKHICTLEAIDMDPDFQRGERAATNIRRLFEGVVGCEELIKQFEGYQKVVANMKARNLDPRNEIPFNFLFCGPPGTGKTTTARKMGKIYYDFGFLSTAEVVEASATDLIGQYVGHTGPKTQKLLEKALGKVLFVDEAYRLAEGHFAKEALDEIVDMLTKTTYAQKLIVILAGYESDMNRLMSVNQGLTSRFSEIVNFRALHPQECIELLTTGLQKKDNILNTHVLNPPSDLFRQSLKERFEKLVKLPNWGNARDVNSLTKQIFQYYIKNADPNNNAPIFVEESNILSTLDSMIDSRTKRAISDRSDLPSKRIRKDFPLPPKPQTQDASPPPTYGTASDTVQKTEQNAPTEQTPKEGPEDQAQDKTQTDDNNADPRDPGVSDATWNQLQLDKQAATAREKYWQDLLATQVKANADYLEQLKKENELRKEIEQQRQAVEAAAKAEAEETQRREAEYKLEQERIRQALEEEQERQQELAKLEEKRRAIEEKKRKEAEAREALRRKAQRELEEKRIRQELERRKREEELARLERERKKAEEERRKEAEAQRKLRYMGLCVAGYRWIKQPAGYRCAGGSHFVSDAQLGL